MLTLELLWPWQNSFDFYWNIYRTFYKDHLRSMCTQLLERNRLPLIWTDILLDLGSNISHFVRPDVRLNKDHMDISPYVHIKKVINWCSFFISFFIFYVSVCGCNYTAFIFFTKDNVVNQFSHQSFKFHAYCSIICLPRPRTMTFMIEGGASNLCFRFYSHLYTSTNLYQVSCPHLCVLSHLAYQF